MDITIQGLNLKVRDSLEDYARKKLDRLDRYLPGITDVRLDLSLQHSRNNGNGVKIAELTVRHRRGAILRAEERVHGDFEVAINQAIDKMYRQIERFKGKRARKVRQVSRFSATIEELDLAEETPDTLVEEVETQPAAEPVVEEIVRRKAVPVSAMTEEEAVEQMELLGHTFFLFFNADTNSINVVYKRESGGYGVLIPNLE